MDVRFAVLKKVATKQCESERKKKRPVLSRKKKIPITFVKSNK